MNKRVKRVLAWAALLLIAVLLVALLAAAFLGAGENILLALLFCIIVVPTVIYVYIWFTGVIRKPQDQEEKTE